MIKRNKWLLSNNYNNYINHYINDIKLIMIIEKDKKYKKNIIRYLESLPIKKYSNKQILLYDKYDYYNKKRKFTRKITI